jgi:hypothetical protein
MPVHPISADLLSQSLSAGGKQTGETQLREWCSVLESGAILYFAQTPVPIPAEDLAVLLRQKQTGSGQHKNIAYKPARDLLTGIDESASSATERAQMHQIMRRYSSSVAEFLSTFLAPYARRWQLDYASYRPFEEQSRDLSTRHRNDLLHTDAFPTRPTRGARILRFFHNIHPDPSRTRDWMVTQPFAQWLNRFTPGQIPFPTPDNALKRTGRQLAKATGLGGLLPGLKRTPYDDFMMRLHNAMKEDADFQQTCPKEHVNFPPGSSWMVYTETVPHAVLAGQFALEQTFLVDPRANVTPDSAPLMILEKLAGAPLA